MAAASIPLVEPQAGTASRILVIEDDGPVRKTLKRLFEFEGYIVDLAADATTGFAMLRQNLPAALVLDRRLPGVWGDEVCREVRRLAPQLPIIVLSAMATEGEKVHLLELGADDYVTKPFSPKELLARVRAAIRRSLRVTVEETCIFGDVQVNFSRTEVTRGNRPVQLTVKEFKALAFLIKNSGRVVTRDELLDQVWGYQNYPCTRTVDNHILRLRQKLEADPANPMHLLTLHGVGYKFVF